MKISRFPKLLTLQLAIIAGLLINNLNAQTSLPDNSIFNPVFEVGVLNGKPAKPEENLVKEEFSIFSANGTTIQVKKKEELPQVLLPGQRIAIFLENLNPENYYLKMLVGCKYDRGKPTAALSVLFNGKQIWQHRIMTKRLLISSVIPSRYLKKDINILQIRNQSMEPVCFDWLKIDNLLQKTPLYMVIPNLDKMPYPERNNFGMGGVKVDFRSFSKSMKIPESLKELTGLNKANQTSEMKSTSIDKQKKNLKEFKEKIGLVIKANSDYKVLFSSLWKQITTTLKCGKEPVILIKGHPTLEEIENLALATRDIVCFWVFEDTWKNIGEVVKKLHIINPGIEICTKKSLPETALLSLTSKNAADALIKANISWGRNMIPELWAQWHYRDLNKLGGAFLRKKAFNLPAHINEWIWSGGNNVILDKVIDGGMFFDELTQEPSSMFYTLKQTSRLFQGNPEKVICNIVPVMKSDFLDKTYWSAAKNADGVITIQITSKYETGKQVKLTCPVPFSGATNCVIFTGFVKPNAKDTFLPELKIVKKLIEVKPLTEGENQPGLFEITFPLSKCTTIRLVKKSAKLPFRPKDTLGRKTRFKPRFKKGILQVSMKHPTSGDRRKLARCANGVLGIQGAKTTDAAFGKSDSTKVDADDTSLKKNKSKWGRPTYAGKRNSPATRSEIDGAKNVVPWASESTLLKIAYPDGKPGRTEGIRLYFGRGPKTKCKEFSFWVYPRSKKEVKKLTLQFLVTSNGKTYFLAVDVKPGIWQRIIMPSDKIKAPAWKDICIVGDCKLPEYKDGNEITFEFNGFSFLSAPDKSFSYRIFKEKTKAGKKPSFIILFFSLPGKKVEYRHAFKKPVEFKKMSLLTKFSETSKPELIYKKDAQILRIKLKFPENALPLSDKLKKLLTAKEKELLKEKQLLCAGIKVEVE